MKIRTFFLTLLLFLVFFYSAIFIVTLSALRESTQSAKERCLAEHYIVAAALLNDLHALQNHDVLSASVISDLMQPYAQFSQGSGSFYLFHEEQCLYAGAGETAPEFRWSDLTDEKRTVAIDTAGSALITVVGRLPAPFETYTLVYQASFEETLSAWQQLRNTLFLLSILFSVLLALSLMLLLNRIFRPLSQISLASQRIAAGEYDQRLAVNGRDELASVAKSFNEMAEEIQKQIAALNDAAEQKQRFIDSFAHELRTPLTAIYGYAQYLQRAAVSEEEKITAAGYILSECRRMQAMASQLLELALLRAEEAPMAEIAVTDLFETVKNLLTPKAELQNITLHFACETPSLYGNQQLLESLLLNLADNAIKASFPGSDVWVTAGSSQADKIRYLLVKDQGKGMSAEELAHITEAFYRVDRSRSRAAGGTGLGLSICAQIAHAHGALLKFYSEKGKGTTAAVIFTTSS